jgi:uncharacterized membrane protein
LPGDVADSARARPVQDERFAMTNYRVFTLLGAIVFLLIAALNLWRLLVGFPITVGGVYIGGATSFIVMCAAVALSLMMFREARRDR